MEPVGGIEPPHPAYKAGPLPLRINRRETGGAIVLAHAAKTCQEKLAKKNLPRKTCQENSQMDGDLLSIPEEAVARSPSNFLDVHDVKQRDAARHRSSRENTRAKVRGFKL